MIGEFNIKNNEFKTVFDNPSTNSSYKYHFQRSKDQGSEVVLSGNISDNHLYAFLSFEIPVKKGESVKYHLLKLDLKA